MTAPRQIVLVGLSGIGKSSVGRELAELLGWPLVDTDDLYRERHGRTPAEAIVADGEPAFRREEEAIVAEAAAREPAVIATGGGAFQSARNRRVLGTTGYICYLDATAAEIARRLSSEEQANRPLLEGDVLGRLEELDAERRPFYLHADLWVPVQGGGAGAPAPEPAATAIRILHRWAAAGVEPADQPRRLDRLSSEQPARGATAVVDTGQERYPIWVGAGELRRLRDRLRQVGLDDRRVFLVSDAEVMERHGHVVAGALESGGIAGASYIVPAGEGSKSTRVANELYRWLAEERAERRDVLLALGGGVVGDLAGYVAATYLRGMPLVMLPTSVLAMNDAAIGGKVAVDLPAGKNLVGAFKQPAAVIADVDTLATLPRRSLVEGFAEVIKHALILDPGLLTTLEQHARMLSSATLDLDLVAAVTARSIRLKALIVSSDPEERGLRAILNYGHTVGHAIEQVTGYSQYLHGEAVAVGMSAAARIGVDLGVTDAAILERQSDLVRAFGLPQAAPGLNVTALMDAMRRDKKVERGQLRFILLEDIGRAGIHADVPDATVTSAVQAVIRG